MIDFTSITGLEFCHACFTGSGCNRTGAPRLHVVAGLLPLCRGHRRCIGHPRRQRRYPARLFKGPRQAHNVYGGPTDFAASCEVIVQHVGDRLGINLPNANSWYVHRVDWAENFVLGFDAIQDFFATMKNARFPRRSVQTYGTNGLYAAGITTTVKLYHKGEEFQEHDFKRIERALKHHRLTEYPQDRFIGENHIWVHDQMSALQAEANKRLRVEVEIHLEKLKADFGHKPFVREVTKEYLIAVFEKEVYRLMRQGKTGDTVIYRNSTAVLRKLSETHSSELANKLHAFWNQMATIGEAETKAAYPRATFYRHRKLLEEAGITWHQADSRLIERTSSELPDDFQLIRSDPRRCTREVIEGIPELSHWGIFKRAA